MRGQFCRVVSMMLILVLLAACAPTVVDNADTMRGTIAISGAFALYPMMTRWAEEFQKIHPGVQFDISAGGAGKGMTDVLTGAVEIGMVSRDVKAEETAQGAFAVPVVKDAVFPVISAQNPVLADLLAQGVTQETFVKIFITGEFTTWGEVIGKPEITDEIHVYTRADAAGAPEVWAKYLGALQEDLLGVGISGDPGLLDAVVKDALGIGYNNLGYAFDLASDLPVKGAVVLPMDVNENGVADANELLESMHEAVDVVAAGIYPSPPARPLNLVTRGKPEGVVKLFIEWILTSGQSYVAEAGYVQLTAVQINAALEKLQ